MYRLSPSEDDSKLFYRLDSEETRYYGAIGYLRADFGRSGREFWSTWFDIQSELKTPNFKYEFDDVINSLRDDGQNPPFATRVNLEAFCSTTPAIEFPERGRGYMIRTLGYSYYFRCFPRPGDYDIYCFCYLNRCLLPALEEMKGAAL